MNLRDLHYLVAVADLKHFGKAAESCHVSQPTLSAQIKKLEDYLGVQLIERNSKQVMLTPVGEDIVARARVIISDAEQIKIMAKQSINPETGSLTLGVIPTLAPYLLPHVVPILKEHYPQLALYFYEDKTAHLLEKLSQGELDAIILALPVPHEGLNIRKLFSEPFFVAMPNDHPLREHEEVCSDELNDENLLLLAEGHCLRDQALEVCTHIGMQQQAPFSATSLETLRQMVAAGAGITLLPALAVHTKIANSEQICVKPFSNPQPVREIAMLWRKSSALTTLLDKIALLLTEEFA